MDIGFWAAMAAIAGVVGSVARDVIRTWPQIKAMQTDIASLKIHVERCEKDRAEQSTLLSTRPLSDPCEMVKLLQDMREIDPSTTFEQVARAVERIRAKQRRIGS